MRDVHRILIRAGIAAGTLVLLAAGCGSPPADDPQVASEQAAAGEADPPAIALEDDYFDSRGGYGRGVGPFGWRGRPQVRLPDAIRPLGPAQTVLVTADRTEFHRDDSWSGARRFSLRVLDAESERPVHDAVIRFFRVRDDYDTEPNWRKDLRARIFPDASGVVRVDVARGQQIAVVARAPGCVPVTAILDPVTGVRRRRGLLGSGLVAEPGSTSATLLLGGGGRLRGRVFDETGEPLAGAHLRIDPPDPGWRLPWRYAYIPNGERRRFILPIFTTDRLGRYDVRGLAHPGRYVVFAGRDTDATGRCADAVFLPDIDELRRDVHLEPTAALTVRVTDEDGVPQADAWLEMDIVSWGRANPSRKDDDAVGEWRFRPLLAGEVRLHVNAVGLVGEVRSVVVDGRSERVEVFALRRGGSLTGRLSDRAGEPIVGVRVRFATRGTQHHTFSSEDGHFEIPGVPDAAGTVQIVAPPGFRSYLRRGVLPRAGPLKITLGRLSSIRGRLDPRPASGTVFYYAPRGSPRTLDVAPDGTFVAEDIDASRPFDLLLWPGGGACHILRGTRVAPGETLDVETLDGSPEARLTGVVVDADGVPLPGATVFVDQFPFAQKLRTRADADGAFTLPLYTRGSGLLVVVADGLPRTHVALAPDPDRTSVELRVFPGGTVAGTVTASDMAGAKVNPYIEFRRKDGKPGRWVAKTTAGLAIYEIRLPEGVYTSRAWIGRGWVAGSDVEVVEGENAVLSIPSR